LYSLIATVSSAIVFGQFSLNADQKVQRFIGRFRRPESAVLITLTR
jgi:hypothetical protein